MAAARKRRKCEIEEEISGKRQKKNHSGNFERMLWDKEALKKEIQSKQDGEKINWSEIARQYKVTNKRGEIAKNGGQIVQEWLVNEGVNIQRFKPQGFPSKIVAEFSTAIGKSPRSAGSTIKRTVSFCFLAFIYDPSALQFHRSLSQIITIYPSAI